MIPAALHKSDFLLPSGQVQAELLLGIMLIQEQPISCILHNPPQPLLKVEPGDAAAADNSPLMRLDSVQLQTLRYLRSVTKAYGDIGMQGLLWNAYLSNVLLAHASTDVHLVREYSQICTHESLWSETRFMSLAHLVWEAKPCTTG